MRIATILLATTFLLTGCMKHEPAKSGAAASCCKDALSAQNCARAGKKDCAMKDGKDCCAAAAAAAPAK